MSERLKWQDELELFGRIKNTLVLTDNIYDCYPVAGDDGRLGFTSSLEAYIVKYLTDAEFRAVIGYDPARGFYELYTNPECGQNLLKNTVLFADSDLYKRCVSEKREEGEFLNAERDEDIAKIFYCILAQKKIRIGMIIRYSSRLLSRPDDPEKRERRLFLCMRLGSENTFENRLFVLADKINDLPVWFYYDNPRLKVISVSKPDHAAREKIIRKMSTELLDTYSIDHKQYDELVKVFVGLSEGMLTSDIQNLFRMMYDQKMGFEQIEKAILLYRHGVNENPWKQIKKETLLDLERNLSKRVVGQEKVIARSAEVIRRAALGMTGLQQSSHSSRPRGVLVFAGPTGTGKTELAKAITEQLFMDDRNIIRFDMSEYRAEHSDQKLLGAPPGYVGYEQGGQLTNAVREHPFSVLLFDEIEKAHPSILDKFLQILDDGRITDGHGDTVYFQDCLIIFTTNLGIVVPSPNIPGRWVTNVSYKEDITYKEVEQKVLTAIKEYYREQIARPELLSRIGDNILVFDYIRPSAVKSIVDMQVERICKGLKDRIGLQIHLAEQAYSDLYEYCREDLPKGEGGRGIGNTVERCLINPLASNPVFRDAVEGNMDLEIERLVKTEDGIIVSARKTADDVSASGADK